MHRGKSHPKWPRARPMWAKNVQGLSRAVWNSLVGCKCRARYDTHTHSILIFSIFFDFGFLGLKKSARGIFFPLRKNNDGRIPSYLRNESRHSNLVCSAKKRRETKWSRDAECRSKILWVSVISGGELSRCKRLASMKTKDTYALWNDLVEQHLISSKQIQFESIQNCGKSRMDVIWIFGLWRYGNGGKCKRVLWTTWAEFIRMHLCLSRA